MDECIFCKIAGGEMPTEFLYESDAVAAFADINPIAPVHVLVVPKEHIGTMNDVEAKHKDTLGEMLLAAQKIAKEKGTADGGYKLLIRTGKDGGQEIPHIHLHLIGGGPLAEDIHAL